MTAPPLTEENPVAVQTAHPMPRRPATDGRRRRLLSAGGLALVAVTVSACGSGSSGGSVSSSSSQGPSFLGSFSGISGKVVAVSSSGAKVLQSSGTAALAFGSSTRFSKISTISLSALAAGDCVIVAGTGRAARASSGPLTARSVSVTSTSGCQGFGRVGGAPGGATPPGTGTPPSGGFGSASPFGGINPSTRPSGSPGTGGGFGGGFGGGRGFGGLVGTVASVSSSSFVVTPRIDTAKVTVKTTSTTRLSATSVVTSSALVTGVCASAIGLKAPDGTVDARSITISSPSNGKCTLAGGLGLGFGFGGGFGGGRPTFGSASPGVASA